jgi:hypothetical protein
LVPEKIYYTRNPDYIFRRIVDEAVLVPIHKDVANMESIFTLNDVGAFIWEQLEQPATQNELQLAIQDEFDAEMHVIAADLEDFLHEMITIGAVRRT